MKEIKSTCLAPIQTIKTRRNGGSARLHPEVRRALLGKLSLDEQATVDLACASYSSHFGDVNRSEIRATMERVVESEDSRFRKPTRRWLEETAGIRGEFKTVHLPSAEPFVAEVVDAPPTAPQQTGIVRVVDGIAFTLSSLDAPGAASARVTLTDLALSLGYSDKARLKELAGRHSQELAEFGTTLTVSVVSGFGRVTQEPTYNPDQAAYLALSSETEQGRACRVRILKAYKALLAQFEAVVAALPAPAVDYQAMAQAIGVAVVSALTPLLSRQTRRARSVFDNPNQQELPAHGLRVVEKDHAAVLRGNPLIRAVDAPSDVPDHLMRQALRGIVNAYGGATGDYAQAYRLLYQSVNFVSDKPLPSLQTKAGSSSFSLSPSLINAEYTSERTRF
jgi:hypothetical protein